MSREMDHPGGLGTMALYVNPRRIYNELTEADAGENPLAPEQLFPFDQIHYEGTDAVRAAAEMLGLTSDHRVLDVGSGLGGPARYLAHTTGCHVTALEIQEEMHTIASDLTRRCHLASPVTHVRGDALTIPLPDRSFDAVVSWLAVHHIHDRPRLCERMARALRPGGQVYIEDLCQRVPFSEADLLDVRNTLHGISMTSAEEYERDFRNAGFSTVALIDMTGRWAAFCARRAAAWQEAHARHVRVHGEDTHSRLERFFLTVTRLFDGGSLGGLRIVARL